MSRAGYVWVVTTRPPDGELTGGTPVTAFTVKYECADWISWHSRPDTVNVCRIRDSHHYEAPPVWLDPLTLEPLEE